MQRDFKGVWIPKEIWLDKELDLTEKALLIEIHSLDNEFHCVAGNDYFAEFLNCSESTITRAIKHLKDLGYIESSFDGRVRKLRIVNLTRVVNLTRQSSQFDEHNNISSNTNNINNINNQRYIIEEDIKDIKTTTMSKSVEKFVSDYNSICQSLPKCTKITAKRKKAITKILKEYSEDEILQVFNNLENSEFCKGNNDNGWKANIDFILREDKFVATLEGKYGTRKSVRTGRNVETTSLHGEQSKVVSREEKEELRRLVELGELEEY